MRLLIVEDNVELSKLLSQGLGRAGYEVDAVSSAADARDALSGIRYAAMILDLGLPDEDGLAVLTALRRGSDPLPVIVLTARGGLQDRVGGLRSGADDYLVKPFALEELVARLEAILRRPGQLLGRSLELGNLVYDTESRQTFVAGTPRTFSARELSVLEILLRRQGRVVPKKAVEDHIFGLTGEVGSNAVEVYVSRLRKQLSEYGATVVIHTIRGVGYMMAAEKQRALQIAALADRAAAHRGGGDRRSLPAAGAVLAAHLRDRPSASRVDAGAGRCARRSPRAGGRRHAAAQPHPEPA